MMVSVFLTLLRIVLVAEPAQRVTLDVRLQELERAIARTWSEHHSIRYKFSEIREYFDPEPYTKDAVGLREIIRDGDKARSRSEAVEYRIRLVNNKHEKNEHRRTLSICDGTHRFQFVTGETTAERAPADDCDNPVSRFRWLREKFSLKMLPDEELDGQKVFVFSAVRQEFKEVKDMKEWQLYYRQDGMLVKQEHFDYKGKLQATLTYTDFEFDAKIDPPRFVFTPPAGVTVKEAERSKPKEGESGK